MSLVNTKSVTKWVLQRNTLTLCSFLISWRSYRISLSGTMLALGWYAGWNWFWAQRDSIEPWNSSCGCWSLWLLLLRTCGFPQHLYLNGKTKPIPFSSLSMVRSSLFLNFFFNFISLTSIKPLSCTMFLSTNNFVYTSLKIHHFPWFVFQI